METTTAAVTAAMTAGEARTEPGRARRVLAAIGRGLAIVFSGAEHTMRYGGLR